MSDLPKQPFVEQTMEKAKQAAAVFNQYSQEQVDRIVRAVYEAGFNNRIKLAKLAFEETHIGRWQDKVIKNVVATQFVYNDIKDCKTVGIISEDPITGISEIAQPMGPILAVIPVTNPTSTVMFKTLICLKARNPIIISPAGKAKNCCIETARILYEAALAADAPEDCIQWCDSVSREQTQAFMSHPDVALILATGGSGLVKTAYSSGTPTIGVGAGNVPIFIHTSADIPFAVEQILISKTFDNGTICASEQAVVVEKSIAEAVLLEFKKQKGRVLDAAERARLTSVAWDAKRGLMNPDVVGQSASKIAAKAGIETSEDTSVLIAPITKVGDEEPLSSEILAPILAFFAADSFDDAVKTCIELNYHGGVGHSAGIYANDEKVIKEFSLLMNAGRIVVNTPSSQGAVGGTFNMLSPSLTLGCGTGGKNITSDNVTARHLLNIQRIARRRENQKFQRFDTSKYLDESLSALQIEALFDRNF
ncbi:MAG: aldehyde dehydrogenase family protein [Candidatus Ozemobacteraceae bacterium]